MNYKSTSDGMEPLAIVGMACRFPGGADDTAAYWELLCDARDAIADVPPDRWNLERFYDSDLSVPGKAGVRQGGFLQKRIDEWDAEFFGVSPREAAGLDPQQRLLLELVWEALEDGGIVATELAGSETGVYIGGFTLDSQLLQLGVMNRDLIGQHTATSATLAMLSNRLSYFFDFRGPSLSIDTACSSSLVALHYACQDLWKGRVPLAIVGGVNVMLVPEYTIAMSKGGFLAPDARSKSFAERADGYARGEGAGVLVVKPLSQALDDEDPIHALVRATGVNQDGRTNGITAPNGASQEALIRRVCREAGVAPAALAFVEAHGTGTALGDVVEARALGSVVGAGRRLQDACLIGSAKANIGHLEAAAGAAGAIKAILCLKHGKVPPQRQWNGVNQAIPWDALGLRLPASIESLGEHRPLYAGVNSFGYGGTNAHAVLERYEGEGSAIAREPRGEQQSGMEHLVPLSAHSSGALLALASAYRDQLSDGECEEDSTSGKASSDRGLFHSMARRRVHHPVRMAFTVSSRAELRAGLDAHLEGVDLPGLAQGTAQPQAKAGPVFVLTGMGPQWWGMGRELWSAEPVFRRSLEACDEALRRLSGKSILGELLADESESRMSVNWVAQQANFALQVGLLELWGHWGIRPVAIVGHSVGEVAAAYAAGCLDLAAAAEVSFHRSTIQQRAAGQGGMLFVQQSEAQAAELAAVRERRISIAAVNSPSGVTLAGDRAALAEVAVALELRGVFHRLLELEVAYHSEQMEPLKEAVADALAALTPRGPKIELYSTVSGERVTGAVHDASYWWSNVRRRVRFLDAIQRCVEDGHRVFLEIGPHPVLSASIREILAREAAEGVTLCSLQRGRPERQRLLQSLGQLYTLGYSVAWDSLYPEGGPYVPLPRYPWQRESFWIESRKSKRDRLGAAGHPLLGERRDVPHGSWENQGPERRATFLKDHKLNGAVVFPAAAYVEAALAALRERAGDTAKLLEAVEFHEALVLPGAETTEVQLEFGDDGHFAVYSRTADAGDESGWRLKVTGTAAGGKISKPPRLPFRKIQDRCDEPMKGEALYESLARRGFEYGDGFRTVRRLWRRDGEVVAEIGLDPAAGQPFDYSIHPALLDAGFQALLACVPGGGGTAAAYVPVGIREVTWYSRPGAHAFSYGRLTRVDRRELEAEVTLCNEHGEIAARIRGLRLLPLKGGWEPRRNLYAMAWNPHVVRGYDGADAASRQILILSRNQCRGEALKGALLELGCERVGVLDTSSLRLEGDVVQFVAQARAGALQDHLADAGAPGRCVVYLCDSEPADTNDDPTGSGECLELLAWIRSLRQGSADPGSASQGRKDAPQRLLVVTRGVQAVPGTSSAPVAPERASLWGLGRVVMNEYPDLECTLVDLDPADQAGEDLLLAVLALAERQEDEFAVRGGKAFAHRMQRVADEGTQPSLAPPHGRAAETPGAPSDGAFPLDETGRKSPDRGELELECRSLAFRTSGLDWSLGEIGGNGNGSNGAAIVESLSRVVRIGEDVRDFAVGNEVLAVTAAAPPAVHWTASKRACLLTPVARRIPADTQVGSYLPLVIVLHALQECGRLHAGERVMVQTPAEDVDVAAWKVAAWLGAQALIVTGDAARSTALRTQGVECFEYETPSDLRRHVLEWSGGEGVHVALLSESALVRSRFMSVLRPAGRIVELLIEGGKNGRRLSFVPPEAGFSYTALDFRLLVERDPGLLQPAIDSVRQAIESGEFAVIAGREEPAAGSGTNGDVAPASPARRRNVYSVQRRESRERRVRSRTAPFHGEATYLVTGGLTGFGSKVAEWMVECGARHVVLAGRRGAATPGADRLVAELERRGSRVLTPSVDVRHLSELESLLGRIDAEMPPLRGVAHLAMVLDDCYLESLDQHRLEKVMAPKGSGAFNLHLLTRERELDHFLLFSSLSALMGPPGQGSYAAANAFLDALAEHRRALGLPALSVNLGLLGEVGVAAGDERLVAHMERFGVKPIAMDRALAALQHVLEGDRANVGFFDVDWAVLRRTPWAARCTRFGDLMEETSPSERSLSSLMAASSAMSKDERAALVESLAGDVVCGVLKSKRERLAPDVALVHYGLDSMMAVELQMTIFHRLGVELAAMELQSITLRQLTARILEKL